MEKESFEDETVAKILNEHFVSIKVDREERPDIDIIYMNFCMILTGSGGWPLTIFMTPDKKPFYAGTYFPKENRYGRIGLIELLLKITDLWKNNQKSILESSEKIFEHLQNISKLHSKDKLEVGILNRAYSKLKNQYDEVNGGFGSKPKFPIPQNYIFLLRYFFKTSDNYALKMVEHSTQKMRLGGIYDQLGSGFHRYSTDEKWLVPHFEKMLYDQALLSFLYTELFQITKNDFYKNTAEEIFNYILRDMTSPEGAFYSAEDADSEGVEGKFYLWEFSEIKKILGKSADIFIDAYNINENGNFSDPHSAGKNILCLKKPLKEISEDKNIPELEFQKMRQMLLEHREKRIRPFKDDKILTDWNGLMIAALANGYKVFGKSDYLKLATTATEFILNKMTYTTGALYHRYRDNEAKISGNLDDYAFFIWGLLELYQSSFETKYLKKAINLQDIQIQNFWDETNGGFYFIDKNLTTELIQRPKIFHDSAIPSGNSISLYNLLRLFHMTGNDLYYKYSTELINAFAGEANLNPVHYTMFLTIYMFAHYSPQEIVIVGNREESEKILKVINNKYNPFRVILLKSEESNLGEIAPYTVDMKKIQNKPTVYICENFTCKLPVNTIEEIENSI